MSDTGLVEEQQNDLSHDSSISSEFPDIITNFGKFESLKTTPLIIAQTVLVIAIETYALFVTFFSNDNQFICESYFILLYLHVIFWFISFAIHHIMEFLHHQLWLNGFFDFHAETKNHQRLPLYVASFFTVNLLLLQTVTQHFYDKTFDDHCQRKHGTYSSPTTFVTGAVSLETIFLLIVNLKYIFKVRRFNKDKEMPDVLKPDSLLFTVNDGATRNFIDFKHETQHVFTFIEKQAQMIQYLRDHVNKLNNELIRRV